MSIAATMSAQNFQGGIRGLVQDPGGAVIATAKITLTNQNTGVARTTVSNAEGEYVFSAIDPATYRVRAETPGFKTLERVNVVVNTQEFLTLDLKLEVGEVNQSVMV